MLFKGQGKNQRMYGVMLTGTLISCFIAFYNNYPLVYPDTGSYLHSAWENVVFYDRTIFYGLFIYEAGWDGVSPFLMVFWQGFMICYLLYVTLKIFFSGLARDWFFIISVTGLALFTGFSYTVSILIPDIFSAITGLALFNLLINRRLHWVEQVLIMAVYLFSICTQLSSLPVLAVVFAFILVFMLSRLLIRRKVLLSFKRFFTVAAFTATTLFIVPAVHYHYDGYYKISGGNHVFIMNHLLETGILEDYLDRHCSEKNYRLCQYKDSLGWDFMWSATSPLQKTGGWEVNRKEYKEIIMDIVGREEYFWPLMRKGVEYTVKQLFTFQTTVSPSQMEGSAPFGQVQWRMPDTTREYIGAAQQNNKLDLRMVNSIEMPLILLSLVFCLAVISSPALSRQLSPELRWLNVFLMLFVVCSAGICANLSTVHPRFENRIIWLLPFCAAIILTKSFQMRQNLKNAYKSDAGDAQNTNISA